MNEGVGFAIEGGGYADKLTESFDKAIAEFGKLNFAKAMVKEGWDD